MISEIYDYIEAGFRVFGLHGAQGGVCGCGDTECKAVLKHPIMSNWQSIPQWSDDQIDCFDQMGHFDSGFGVLCRGWLIVDVDARNGGVASFAQLCADVPSVKQCGFVVNTGSGGGSQHHYFRLPDSATGQAFVQSLPAYKGIDFKTSGYVVGAGSMHASGSTYEAITGYPQDTTDAPPELLALITKPAFHRVSNQGADVDVDEAHIRELLHHCNPNCGYAEWITIGMAVHHCMSGCGFEAWDDWSSKGATYRGAGDLQKHWHSFGKSANPAGYGTLLHYAREGGYCEPVTFVYDGSLGDVEDGESQVHGSTSFCVLDDQIDVRRPPGFVGELTQWINDQCLYPRENLAVAAALTAVSSLAGMRYTDSLDGMTPNLMTFCVAGSSTGKETILQCYLNVMKAAGVQAAVHGGFKSEQEVMRNLIRHQAAFYCIDELGITLHKLHNASKRGGASYLEGVVGQLMSVYSKANGYLPITGDLKEEIKAKLILEYAQLERKIEGLAQDSSADAARERMEDAKEHIMGALQTIDDGLENPYLTLIGFTTPVTFNDLMTFEQATNGFLARAMVFSDLETNPKRKSKWSKKPMPEHMANALRNLYAHGHYDMRERTGERIQHLGDKVGLPTMDDAAEAMNEVYERFYAMAEEHKGATGLEAIARRGYELTSKISMICAMPSGLRTLEHVRFGYALARRDIEQKIRLAYGTDNKQAADGLAARVLSIVSKDHGELAGVICGRLRGTPKAQVEALLDQMIDKGMLRVEESIHPSNKRVVKRYFAA